MTLRKTKRARDRTTLKAGIGTSILVAVLASIAACGAPLKGNLASVWTPSTAPAAPGADNDPAYTVWAIQSATSTAPALLTLSVSLDVNPAN